MSDCAMLGCRQAADDLQGSVFGFLATCTPKVVVELLFSQRHVTVDG